jgi:hypothetical protein
MRPNSAFSALGVAFRITPMASEAHSALRIP